MKKLLNESFYEVRESILLSLDFLVDTFVCHIFSSWNFFFITDFVHCDLVKGRFDEKPVW